MRFTHKIQKGDIVIANKGIDQVVGIGKVLSDYIAPTDSDNPSNHNEYRHARLIDWMITEPLGFGKQVFPQHTVSKITPENWDLIRKRYLAQYPQFRDAFTKLTGGEEPHDEPEPRSDIDPLVHLAEHTRNFILYGPPGTGKTFLVRKFAHEYLQSQLTERTSNDGQRAELVAGLTWYNALALTMALASEKSAFKVGELLEEPLMKEYVIHKNANQLSNAVWSHLQVHTHPDIKTVAHHRRMAPFLFAKDEQAKWSLTSEGVEYVVENLATELSVLRGEQVGAVDLSTFCTFVTFHQSFAYEEFVEGLKPVANADEPGAVSYEVLPGVFRQICERAESAWRRQPEAAPKYVLVIDEINRANIAKVFGELITLLEDDKRLGKPNALQVQLPYSGDTFGVPPNLYVIGTMNTADRSIALLDLALRRRFSFLEIVPDPSLLNVVANVDLPRLLSRLNERIELLLDRDHRIGHSYLMKLTDETSLHFAWFNKVLPLLQEYFYNDNQRLHALLGDLFLERITPAKLPAEMEDLVDFESPRFVAKPLEPAELRVALDEWIARAS